MEVLAVLKLNLILLSTDSVYVDGISFTTQPFRVEELSEEQDLIVTQPLNALTDDTAEIEFNLGTAVVSGTGSPIIEVSDDSGNTRTLFTATRNAIVTFSADAVLVSANRMLCIAKNGTVFARGTVNDAGTTVIGAGVSSSFRLAAGDYLTYGSCSDVVSTGFTGDVNNSSTNQTQVRITARADNTAVVTPAKANAKSTQLLHLL